VISDVSDPSGEPADLSAEPHSPRPGVVDGFRVSVNLEVLDTDPPLVDWLGPRLAQVASVAGLNVGQVQVCVVGEAVMDSLHQRYRSQPGPTDVLSFDLRDDPDEPLEGDIIICKEEAARQAACQGHETRSEILLCAVHGLLHLAGLDDQTPEGFEQMHWLEDELLTRIGVGPIFDHRGNHRQSPGPIDLNETPT